MWKNFQYICRYLSHYPLNLSAELRLWWKFSAELTSWEIWAELFLEKLLVRKPQNFQDSVDIYKITKTSKFYSLKSAKDLIIFSGPPLDVPDNPRFTESTHRINPGEFLRLISQENPRFTKKTHRIAPGEFSAALTLWLKFSAERNFCGIFCGTPKMFWGFGGFLVKAKF